MIKQLYIKDFTLISELNIKFNAGFSVITGETGAGKSIILGAIGLLLGQRADNKLIKFGCSKCTVEAHFDLSRYDMKSFFERIDVDFDSTDCIIRREINSNGKSRAFINDTPVSLSTIKELGDSLIDVHSQHQNLLLNKEDFQLNVIDILARDTKELYEYKTCYEQLKQAQKRHKELIAQINKDKDTQDYLTFRYNELCDAALNDTEEQEQLEQSIKEMSHAEAIKSAYYETDNLMAGDTGYLQQIKSSMNILHNIENVHGQVSELIDRIEQCYIELKDISGEVTANIERVDFDPDMQEKITKRLDAIYSLEQKFHVSSIEELIAEREQLAKQLDGINNMDAALAESSQEIEQLETQCIQRAATLEKLRKKAAKKIEGEMLDRLVPMGIPNVRFEIDFQKKNLSPDGCDKVSFLFSANKSTPLLPVSQVASGGEIARVMFSLKAMISGAVKLPTIIFDEIDTGISGKVAEQMAGIMKEMGQNNRQVISITHLPQIAAMGTTHYKVSKQETHEGTVSQMVMLTPEERVTEIAQMVSGSNITPEAINNAKALLGL